MTWTRLSDDFTDRPAIMLLSDAAFRTHVEALVWSNRMLTDGALPALGLRRIVSAPDLELVTSELVSAELWTKTATGWQLDWADQESAEQVESRRADWRRRDDRRRNHNKGDHSGCDPKRCHYLMAHPDALTSEAPRDTRSGSPPPPPLPIPDPDPQGGRGDEEGGAVARFARAPRAPRFLPKEEDSDFGFTFTMPDERGERR